VLYLLDHACFFDATCIMPCRSDIEEFNINKLRSLNFPIARINTIHTEGSEAHKADSDVAKGLESYLLLSRGLRIMLKSNLWTEASLVNGLMGTVQEIIYEENQIPPSLPIAVIVEFDNYSDPTILTADGKKLILIVPIRYI